MGVPKNYQKTVNLSNRIKALNDLNFYTFKYKLNLTEEAITTIYENLGEDILETFEEFIGLKKRLGPYKAATLSPRNIDIVKLKKTMASAKDCSKHIPISRNRPQIIDSKILSTINKQKVSKKKI